MSIKDEDVATRTPEIPLIRLLSLPHELLQSMLSLVANFEPWTYASTSDQNDTSFIVDESSLYTRYTMAPSLKSVHQITLGLSSESDWLMLVLSRHPYHLSRSDKCGISSAITQALRRRNARIERLYWGERNSMASLQIPSDLRVVNPRSFRSTSLQDEPNGENAQSLTPKIISMKQYHATVQPEEEVPLSEGSTGQYLTPEKDAYASSPSFALIKYDPAPLLKLRQPDIARIARQQDLRSAAGGISALLFAVIIAHVLWHLSLLEALQKLDCDTAIPSVEPREVKDFATRELSPYHDRMRSLSGSTVAEPLSNKTSLAFSTIATVCNFDDRPKEVKWAEKRVTDEQEDTGSSPKRPKLSEYKQVSSGRVAALMDRFEKFHL
ncbi:hypothetical protein SVAN01_07367 [Stagonosporopsis vannaccii]|nr:hypothetical protein SVAN01_07367 [Stagonosporopsis vannaccii]